MANNRNIRTYRIGGHCLRLINHSWLEVEAVLPSFIPFSVEQETEPPLLEAVLSPEPAPEEVATLAPTAADGTNVITFDWEEAACTIHRHGEGRHTVLICPRATAPQAAATDNSEKQCTTQEEQRATQEEQSIMQHGEQFFMQCEEQFFMQCEEQFGRSTIYLGSHTESPHTAFILNNFLMMLYAFRSAPYATLLMHASVVAHNGRGYLFLGKSGTGKSTHTSLWLRHIPTTHLLNDDNPIVRIVRTEKPALSTQSAPSTSTSRVLEAQAPSSASSETLISSEASEVTTPLSVSSGASVSSETSDSSIIVYGSPWSGKTPCYRNEQMPIGAFVRLEQAPQNNIRRIGPAHAFAALLPSCSCLKQEPDIQRGIVESVTHLATHCPTFHLRCLPDEAAAQLCQATVTPHRPENTSAAE